MSKELIIKRPADIHESTLVISSEILKNKEKLIKLSNSFTEITEKNHKKASETYSDLHTSSKNFDESRKEVTAPIEAFKKSIIALVKPHLAEVVEAKESLGKRIHVYETELKRIAEEERKAAEEKARKEQAEYEKRQREAEAKAKAANDFPEAPVEPAPAPVAVQVSKPIVKSSLKVKKVMKLYIDNPDLIPNSWLNDDGVFQLTIPNESEIRRAFKAGIAVPGCRWVEEEQVGSK